MSVRHLGDGNAKEIYRSWDFINNTAIAFHGSDNFPANNAPMDFVAYFVEFTAGSDMIVQNGTLIVDGADVNQEFIATLSPSVNATNSFYMFEGLTMDHTDVSWGSEEFGIMRVKNDTSWGYEPANAPNSGDTEVRFSVIDWNNSNFIIQNGTGALQNLDLIDTIVPSPAIDRRHTIVLISTSFDGEEDATSDEYGVTGRINSSNEVEIEREDADCGSGSNCIVNYRWELITFPTTFANVTHDQIFKTSTTPSDQTVSTIDIFSPALGNASKAIAIGTNHNPMGLGQARDSSGSTGTWDRNAYTIELVNATAVNGTANDARNSSTIPYQVIEFLAPAGQVFDQDILDVVTAIDLSQNKNVTKLTSDIAGTADTVSAGVIFVVNLGDNATATDVLTINVTKLALDAVSVGDDPSFVVSKLLNDIVAVNDTTNVVKISEIGILDTVTADDLVILNITKQFSDVTSVIDDLNLNPTKVFIDTTSVVDTTTISTDTGINQTDTTVVFDNIIIDMTKLIQDVATTSDNVIVGKLIDLQLIDTAIVSDPSILFTISTVTTNGSGTGSAGSGGGVPVLQRLVGLSIESELFFVGSEDEVSAPSPFSFFNPQTVVVGNEVPSDFIISTFGRDDTGVSIKEIKADQEFESWFLFPPFPQPLDFQTEVDTSRSINDPARFQNTALQDYILTIPKIACSDVDPFESLMTPCIDPIVYEVPVIFTLAKGGAVFDVKHIVTVDNSTPVVCDPICQLVDFLVVNWWWLAGILVMFVIMYFVIGSVKNKGIRTIRRIERGQFTSFSADKPKRKFKRGKR